MKKNLPYLLGLLFLMIWIASLSNEKVLAQSDGYVGPDACMDCHQDEYDEWTESEHKEAYTNTNFQEEWVKAGNLEDCLQCHTTGYDIDTKEYANEGVTCEACHGEGYAMLIDRSAELCGSCHSGEYGEYRYEDFLEGTHSGAAVTCVDCHAYEQDHNFKVQAESCAICHTGERIHSSSIITEMQARAFEAEDEASQFEMLVNELQTELLEVEKRTEFITQLTYIGGGALFLVIIFVVINYLLKKRV